MDAVGVAVALLLVITLPAVFGIAFYRAMRRPTVELVALPREGRDADTERA